MTRIIRSVGFVLALASVGLGGGALAWTASSPAAAQSGAYTPLPPGWELCVLEGLAAPATPTNIADLDEWQAAEGGSTNNTAAFNPFNSLRTTDVTGAAIPGVDTSNNFPAFSTWAAGCSATVATLYQPNMWVITAALRAGNVTPASAFLAVVDQSAWCAVSPAGVPCYVNEVLSGATSLPASLPVSSALNVYGNVKSDLSAYQQSIQKVSTDQNEIGIRDLALAAASSNVATAHSQLGAASRSLQKFAVNEYVSSGLYSGAPLVSSGTQPLSPSTPQDSDGVVVQEYLGVAASNLVTKEGAANGVYKDAEQRRDAASKALAQAAVTLTSDQAAENQDLTQLISDVGTLEHAGACATVTITPPPTSATDATGATSTTTTTTTTAPSTTSTVPATTTTIPPTTTTTTTTTVPTTVPLNALTPVVPTTTTTTVPPTTTTTVPPTTTTTTAPVQAPTVPSTTTTSAPPAEAAGVGALQGCIASFAPATST